MGEEFIKQLDKLYRQYGYEARPGKYARAYIFTKGIYNGADIVNTGTEQGVDELRNQYSQAGYAVKTRNFTSIEEAEDALFRDFFKADGVINNLKRRYEHFVGKIMDNLPEKADYQYITSSYDYAEYKHDADDAILYSVDSNDNSKSLVSKVVAKIDEYQGPLLIVIEAAAGYGKTCTAYEILNKFISLSTFRLPFFTELSRDRSAKIFKHILQFEIEEQFSNRVDSKLVIDQIKKGRIPLIIDGFDELIVKDFSFSTSQFEQVESMLSTIVDLLTDNAKIIITSRKTAIFNSEEFHNWMLDREINYTLAKITIAEPKIEDWLDRERHDLLLNQHFPLEQIANPVLLTYLRYVRFDEMEKMVNRNDSIVKRYIDFLLIREQTRQNLLMEPEIQLRIFKKLVRLLTELDTKAESKEFVKELILDYNTKILDDTKKKYTPDKRPRTDQLADILSNHAFLDRKENGKIGIVNEFILGTLVAENLISGKYLEHNKNFYNELSQAFAMLAIQSFRIQNTENKEKLWNIFNSYDFDYDPQFFFKIDLDFKRNIIRNYKSATLCGFLVENIIFSKKNQFDSSMFTDCIFYSCKFSLTAFKKCTFINCKFYNCELISCGVSYSDEYFSIFGCTADNNFINHLYKNEIETTEETLNVEKNILELYFKIGSFKPRHRQLSHIRTELSELETKEVSKTIHKLVRDGFIQLNGDLSFLTRKGISYFNDKYRTA